MEERRKYPRFELNVDARYRVMDSEEIFRLGTARNISAEGICFDSQEELKVGVYVELEVDLEDKEPPVHIVGEIRWSSQILSDSKKKTCRNGVKIVNIPVSDENRFLKYYCDKMVEKLSEYLKL